MARLSPRHWFLPETPDIAGLLRNQVEVTLAGVDALCRWAGGDGEASEDLRAAEAKGDVSKRELLTALRAAFVTPLEPEDVFTLSRGIDWILNQSADLVKEAQVMNATPDPGIAKMTAHLRDSVRHIDRALESVATDEEAAAEAAYAAIAAERRLEDAYYAGMAALLGVPDRSERISRRELYRRCSRIGETVIEVSERIVYAGVKES
jgi:uncharacterized protein Yka (UPF0111/DUF47 family)